MLKSKFCLGVFLVGLVGQALALQTPEPPPEGDSRIRYVAYHPDQVVRVDAGLGYSTRIVFAVGEEILDIASGDSAGWHFMVRKNILYLKPKVENSADTNVEIQTNKRAYSFDLRVVGKSQAVSVSVPGKIITESSDWGLTQDAMYRVQFVYPDDEKVRQTTTVTTQKLEDLKNATRVQVRNWKYTMQVFKNSKDLMPSAAFDDGRFTYFRFPNNREFPAIYAVRDDGSEQLLNTHVEEDWIVVQRLAKKFFLRINDQTIAVYNEAFDVDGVPATSGSTISTVDRVLKP
jgi:type IV secretion system protein VirB9